MADEDSQGPWTEEEDSRLRSCVQQYGPSWAVIAQKMENRSADRTCPGKLRQKRDADVSKHRMLEALEPLVEP